MTFKHLGEYYTVVCQYEKMQECLDKCDYVNSVRGDIIGRLNVEKAILRKWGSQLTRIYKKSIDTHFVEAK